MTKNDDAWEKIFREHEVLSRVERDGAFKISAAQIKKFREPRLMTKFDHRINLPKNFAANDLSILPVTRGDYLIAHFETWHDFEPSTSPVVRMSLPEHLQSLDTANIFSEAVALNCALAAGIIADFTGDENIFPTADGRMSSGAFDFKINDTRRNFRHAVSVSSSQIEIDAAYEGVNFLTLIEAKRDLSDDFLIRQLYYPYRTWRGKIRKPIKPVFLVYSNGIFYLREYSFDEPDEYNSLRLVKQRRYCIERARITLDDVRQILHDAPREPEPDVPFPQADKFERVINLCELLCKKFLTRDEITARYAFDARQTDYYANAARYLGLTEKFRLDDDVAWRLSDLGGKIFSHGYRERQLALCRRILSHKVFADVLKIFMAGGQMPSREQIVRLMKNSALNRVGSDVTFGRRASTISGWLNWIVGIIDG